MLKKNKNLSGVKNWIRRHREKGVAVVAENFRADFLSGEKSDIDLLSERKG